MNWIIDNTKGDKWIWLIIMFLSIISLLAVYSAIGTLAYKRGVGAESILIRHIGMMIAGLVLMYACHMLDYNWYKGISKVLMAITLPLLLITLVFGHHVNEASRWIAIPGTGLSFQTSDLAKLALITYLARTLSRKQENIKNVKESFIPIMSAVCAVFILIAWANMSTAIMLFCVSILLLIMGRISVKQIAIVCVAGAILCGAVMLLGPRRHLYISRISTFMHPESVPKGKSFQSDHAKIAIATGGIFGKGIGHSDEINYLPEAYSDEIYAIIVEEYGLIGGFIMIGIYLFLLYRCIKIAKKAPRAFGTLLAAGLSFSLIIQAFVNMAVAVGLGPVTGVTLPLVSMGGTSILFTSIAFGIILSVSRDNEKVVVGEIKEVD
jgi:cell division protein FtsW